MVRKSRDEVRVDDRERYAWYKSKGICVRCKQERAVSEQIHCQGCLDKIGVEIRERWLRTKSDEEAMAKRKESRRRRVEERRSNNQCTRCGKALSREDVRQAYKQCVECRIINRRKGEKRRRRLEIVPRSVRGYLELCWFCGRSVLEGFRVCETHYKMCNDILEVARNSPKMIEHRKLMKEREHRYLVRTTGIDFYQEKEEKDGTNVE